MAGDKKLKKLMDLWPTGHVATSTWLRHMGISTSLTQRYVKSEWIESIGRSAYKRVNDKINWYGALASLQQQLMKKIHLGGPTALAVRGTGHYLRFGKERVFLFHNYQTRPPKWFLQYDWDQNIESVGTSVFPEDLAIKALRYQGFEIRASGPERAILECLYLAPGKFGLLECYQIMESLRTLRPDITQTLLGECRSVKVNRLFLYMADKANLPVLDYLETSKIDLGSGDRAIVKNGVYNSQYKISVPKELDTYA